MKKILTLFVILFSLSACQKNCSDDLWLEGSKYLEITKTSKGICVKNKYIYPVKITSLGSLNVATAKPNVKILSGLSKTFKWEDFDFYRNNTPDSVKNCAVFYERDLCDYKDRRTLIVGYHADIASVQF